MPSKTVFLAMAPLLFAATSVPSPAPSTTPLPFASPAASAKAAHQQMQSSTVPPAPPDGTYVYAISRNGTDQGKTSVTIFRRNETGEIETNESGYVGAARAQIVAAFRYKDLVNDAYVATYRAPFLHAAGIGHAAASMLHGGVAAAVTERYRLDGTGARATIDGVAQSQRWPALQGSPKPPAASRFILDAPFMTGAMLVPAYRHRSGSAVLAPISNAFDEGLTLVPEKLVSTAPQAAKTPKTDAALELTGIGTLWFDRGNYIVHEVHFDNLNLDARLIGYYRSAVAASPAPDDATIPKPHVESRPLTIENEDGTKLVGSIDLPAGGKPRAAAIVFVPPGPTADRNFQSDGPDPMYPSLAIAFSQRGYAVIRYDARSARGPANAPVATWDQSLSDIEAALRAAGSDDAVDPNHIYLLGYGLGADLALAASSSSDASLAGVIALAPTVTSYGECARRTSAPVSGAFFKSASAHNPGVLAARSHVPLFVLHPGVATCDETKDETLAYDDMLHAANSRATIISAADLSARFGGLYDANAPLDTEEFFPYHFDGSTASAIGDWLDNPKVAVAAGHGTSFAPANGPHPQAPPPPPHVANPDTNGEMPNPHATSMGLIAPGVVLPSGVEPPYGGAGATPAPSPT